MSHVSGLMNKLGLGGTSKDEGKVASKHPDAEASALSDTPGGSQTPSTKIRNTAEKATQSFAPLKSIHSHAVGFHCYADDIRRQVIAHHYCSHINEDVRQCVIYDSDKKDARLIGVEYMIRSSLWETLPEEEKKYWHSHKYEVLSGQLVAPELPEPVERTEMADLVNTYGKTIHTWQIDRGDTLPLGPPQLMMSFTADGQLDPQLLAQRDSMASVDSGARGRVLSWARVVSDIMRAARQDNIKSGFKPSKNADQPINTGKGYQLDLVDCGDFWKGVNVPVRQD